MTIRKATMNDLESITAIEAACFPEAEAASKESFKNRLLVYPDYFWLMEEEQGKVIGFINGFVTNEEILTDEMFADAHLHDPNGDWQMIFGVATLPEYQKQGYAARIMEKVIEDARVQERKGLVLTCKDKLLHYYSKFGFINEGVSGSVHGGAVWYDMRLTF